MSWRLLFLWIAVWTGCGGDDDATPDAGHDSAVMDDGATPNDAAQPDTALPNDGGHDAAMVPTLPACNLVCDRVIDCASESCVGVDWRTARVAQGLCEDTCGAAFNDNVMAAANCAAVLDVVATANMPLDSLCNDDPCVTACDAFATCTLQQCERYASQTHAQIAAGCMGWCEPANAGDILNVTCEALIAALDENDPSFAAGCHGSLGCAEMSACVAYADKTTACMLDNCDGNADDFESSIVAALVDYCANAEDCPAPESIALINGESFTCADPPLNAVGPAAPFTNICAGTVGATHAELLAACDSLIACGAEFASNEICVALLTFSPGADTKAMCIDAALDCPGAFACL